MRIAILAAAVIASAHVAAADGLYISEQPGCAWYGAGIQRYLGDAGFSVRVALGMRRGWWAVQVWGGAALNSEDSALARPGAPYPAELDLYGVDLKRYVRLSRHTELYARVGASAAHVPTYTDFGERPSAIAGFAGRGLGGGAGATVKGHWWRLAFAAYFDFGYDYFRLHGGSTSIDASLSSVSIGWAIGGDF